MTAEKLVDIIADGFGLAAQEADNPLRAIVPLLSVLATAVGVIAVEILKSNEAEANSQDS